jgi:hypothetical protein
VRSGALSRPNAIGALAAGFYWALDRMAVGLPRTSHRPALVASTSSTVASLDRVLLTLATGIFLALLFGARGIVHAGKGMEPGLQRDVTLAIGQPLLAVTDATRLTWPWDRAESALGRQPDTGTSALLAAGSTITPAASSQTADPKPTPTPAPKPLRVPTRSHPLRLLVTGDSLTEFMGPHLVNEATQLGPVVAWSDTHYGTGIVRPDFVDWAALARQQMRQYHPEAVVVFMGGNDFQNMTAPDGRVIEAASPEWTREYARRAAICMRLWTEGSGRRVYWLAMPPARDAAWTAANLQINKALRQAASEVPGAEFVNVLQPLTDHGRYADFVDVDGTQVAVRTPDGIHFTEDGSTILAQQVLGVLRREWHLGARPRATPVPSPPAPAR